MGFSKKSQTDGGLDSESKKWVIAGIAVRSSLKPIKTRKPKVRDSENDHDDRKEEEESTTPTAKESRIPERLPCPPAPRKRRPSSSRCNFRGAREFFNPPDLESIFETTC